MWRSEFIVDDESSLCDKSVMIESREQTIGNNRPGDKSKIKWKDKMARAWDQIKVQVGIKADGFYP